MYEAFAARELDTRASAAVEKVSDTPFQKLPINEVLHGDSRRVLKRLPRNSIDLVVSDPPYFLDGLDTRWRKGGTDVPRATGTIGGLPVAMKFDQRQGQELQKFMAEVGAACIDVLKPGAFALFFSQPRLSHRMAVALEDTGFEIRDLCVWHYTKRSQFKAFSQDHFVRKMRISDEEKRRIIDELGGRRTPQLRPQHETIILAQKPREGTFVENWLKWKTGLMDASVSLDHTKPANVMLVEKASLDERGPGNEHLTPKPLRLLSHLIKLFSVEGQVVLDPFLGSGSTAIAAAKSMRKWIGVELNPDYVALSRRRLRETGAW